MSIPVIGTAVVTNPYWVKRLIASVDYPVDNFCIINNNGRGEIDAELDEVAKMPHPFIKKIKVVHMPSNYGVSGAWNLIIKSYLMAPFWIIVNDDVAFGEGLLKEMHETVVSDPTIGMVHPYGGDFGLGSYDIFLIRDIIIQTFGLFDENLYPAYGEDADYCLRFIHRPIRRVVGLKAGFLHGNGGKDEYYKEGSQTQKSDPSLVAKLDYANRTNMEYLFEKWGNNWRHCDPTPNPFPHQVAAPISQTTFDLAFVRKKHMGF